MIPPQSTEIRLVTRLIELAKREDRGALAALRSGVGKPPGSAPRMLPIVAPYISADEGASTSAAFITSALFATHPEHGAVGSLGASLWLATERAVNLKGKHREAGVETRLAAALDAEPEDLPPHLEGLVSLCASAGVSIDWHRFFRDVSGLLGKNEGYQIRIRTRWARDFWRGPEKPTKDGDSN